MANVHTYEHEACLAQIEQMTQAGCELVRLGVPGRADTDALSRILPHVRIPVIADVHFHYQRAIEAIESGIQKIRLNPGNINDRRQVAEVISACKANGTAIRIGVNQGSIVERRNAELRKSELEKPIVELMLGKLVEYVEFFEANDFGNLVLSAKCHDAATCIAVNRAVSKRFDYPLHLGLTHSGDVQAGSIRSSVAIGALLAEGIGDTIRVSLAGSPVTEIEVAWEILNCLGIRPRTTPRLIACPTCSRTEIDLIGLVGQVKAVLADVDQPITVAVMGCVVNGPGEADGADIALCGGRQNAAIYCRGKKVATVPAEEALAELANKIKNFTKDHGPA